MSHSYRSLKLLAQLSALAVMGACSISGEQTAVTPAKTMDMLVSADWLNQHIDDPDLVVLDCTVLVKQDETGALLSVSGRDQFEAGHIPGAGFADLTAELSDPAARFEFSAPYPEEFAAVMAALGIGDNSRVVLYDTYNSAWAARVWWMLRWIGFDQVALLDGGVKAWTDAGHPLSSEPPNRPAGKLSVSPRPELFADIDDVRASIDDDNVNLIDSLPDASFSGAWPMYGRPGHIAGATNVPSPLVFDEAGRYRSADELDMLFEDYRDKHAITYCGGGIAAASNAFALTLAGYKNVAVYDNSLQEWAADPENPMQTRMGPNSPTQ